MIATAIRTVVDEECVYSIGARFGDFGPRTSIRGISAEIVGAESLSVAVDLPRHLSKLACSLRELGVSADDLLFAHTLFPLHAPFITASQREHTIEAMTGSGHPHFVCGMAASTIKATRRLRKCPECMDAGMSATGCWVWLRGHQAAGVLVCAEHGRALWSTDVIPYRLNASPALVTARLAATATEELLLPDECPHLIGISGDVAWLLHNREFPGPDRIHAVCYDMLRERGYLRADGSVRVRKLSDELCRHYSLDLLTRLGTPLDPSQRDNWVERLARRPKNSQAPLRHILFFRFLGLDAKQTILRALHATPLAAKSGSLVHQNKIQILSTRLRDAQRAAWLSALKNQTSEPLRTTHDSLYSWLWRNDRDWLVAHRPPRRIRSAPRVDWPARDLQLTSQIDEIAAKLRAQTNPFVRITKNRVVSETDKAAWFARPNPNLPKAFAAVARVSETPEDFAIRRISSAVRQNPTQKLPLWKLRITAGIGAPVAKRPLVHAALHALSDQAAQSTPIR